MRTTILRESRCQLPACGWVYAHASPTIVAAAWRAHYASHLRGEQCLADYARTGTVHPVAPLPPRAASTTSTPNR